MSDRARHVLRLIDAAVSTRDRHPTLFAAQARNDRDVRHLAAAVDRYKREKPTVHVRPDHDEVERVDQTWEETEARRRQERFTKDRVKISTRRVDERLSMDAFALHRLALQRAGRVSTVPAGNIEPSRSTGIPGGVPFQQTFDDDPRWEVAWRIIRRQLLAVHDLIDEASGLSQGAAVAQLDGTEKDRAILDQGEGLIAEDVVAALGREYGSASYVRRLRKERGLDTRGYPKADH